MESPFGSMLPQCKSLTKLTVRLPIWLNSRPRRVNRFGESEISSLSKLANTDGLNAMNALFSSESSSRTATSGAGASPNSLIS